MHIGASGSMSFALPVYGATTLYLPTYRAQGVVSQSFPVTAQATIRVSQVSNVAAGTITVPAAIGLADLTAPATGAAGHAAFAPGTIGSAFLEAARFAVTSLVTVYPPAPLPAVNGFGNVAVPSPGASARAETAVRGRGCLSFLLSLFRRG